jgi:hypothetical protein
VLLLLCEWWQAMGFRGSLSAANHLPELNLRLPAGGGPGGGLHVTDASNASRTNLMDLRALAWHEPTLRLFGVSPDMLPDIRSNAEVYGWVLRQLPAFSRRARSQRASCAARALCNPVRSGCSWLSTLSPLPLIAAPLPWRARCRACPYRAAWATSRQP